MLQFLKVFLRGVITVVALPVIVLIWVFYTIYCVGVFIVMFFKGVVDYFRGNSFNPDMTEDLESRRMLLEREKQNEQAKDALSMMYQNAMAQTITPPSDVDTNEIVEDPYEENPEPFSSNEYESDAYAPDEEESEDLDNGDFDDDLRGN